MIMSEEEIQGICTYDPWYTIHYKNLQEETPINRAQDTYISNCRQKQKAREERKRIEKEQAYIDAGSWDVGIKWKKKTKRNGSKNRSIGPKAAFCAVVTTPACPVRYSPKPMLPMLPDSLREPTQ